MSDPIDIDLGANPASLDPHHFADGDEAFFGFASHSRPVVIENATVIEHAPADAAKADAFRSIMISGLFGDSRHTRAALGSLIHRQGCAPCDAFNAAWSVEESRTRRSRQIPHMP